jgi:hypothetical protein
MKDIYRNMNRQNILNFYGSKLDLRLDSSELFDFELSNDVNYNSDVIDFSREINYSGLTVDSNCLTNFQIPWVLPINSEYNEDDCDFNIRRRTEKGWTLDFVFNKEDIEWSNGSTFYYWGISGETVVRNYADNNLSFSFTGDGRIKWESYRYSGVCDNVSGYSESFYVSSGVTPTLCLNGTSTDFNVTITFTRDKYYEDCEIENEGGWNDLILGPHSVTYVPSDTGVTANQITTGYTVTNSFDVLTGATPTYEFIEKLNKKWNSERQKRLGTLKIYLNGNVIYKLKNWEEVIPSNRESENPIVQIFGGGVSGYQSLHTGNTEFNMLQVKYYEEPLHFVNVRHYYKTIIKPNFNITECFSECEDQLSVFFSNGLLTEDGEYIYTENNKDIILY